MTQGSGATHAGALTVVLVVLAGSLVACGDPVTGPHDWKVIAALSSHGGVSSGNIGYVAHDLQGPLLNDNGAPVAGSSFSEQCTDYASGYTTPEDCLVIVNSGVKVYVARGNPSSVLPFRGTFKTPDASGTVTVSLIPSNWQGPVEQVLVTVRKAGG
jgi:hypothetical protein